MSRILPLMSAGVAFGCCIAQSLADQPALIFLGDLPGGGSISYAHGISSDGEIVVGRSFSDDEAFRWTESTGMVGLGFFPNGGTESEAFDISGDGSVIVGSGRRGDGMYEPFRWTATDGMIGLGGIAGASGGSYGQNSAIGANSDGTVIVGIAASPSGYQAFRWTETGGMMGLGLLSGAAAVSADGSVVVGSSSGEAFRWTESTGMIGLGFLPGETNSSASAISADGKVIVGSSGPNAFRWTEAEGMSDLGDIPVGSESRQALGVSADGCVIVGVADQGSGEAFIWTAATGMRAMEEVLTDFGLELTPSMSARIAYDVSADGLTFAGWGGGFEFANQAFVAHIPLRTAPTVSFTKVVDAATSVPGDLGTFQMLDYKPVISGDNVAFEAESTTGLEGVYLSEAGERSLVADQNTPIPSGSGNFSTLIEPSLSGSIVAFEGLGTIPDQRGIYVSRGGTLTLAYNEDSSVPGYTEEFRDFFTPSLDGNTLAFAAETDSLAKGIFAEFDGSLQVIANQDTPVPGGIGQYFTPHAAAVSDDRIAFHNQDEGIYRFFEGVIDVIADENTPVPGWVFDFTSFTGDSGDPRPAISGDNIAFYGTGLFEQQGVYADIGGLRVIADRNTPVPLGVGDFLSFFDDGISIQGENVVFLGEGYIGQLGIHIDFDGYLMKLIDLEDILDGQALSFDGLSIGREAISGNRIAFWVRFTNGTEAIYVATVHFPYGDLNGDGCIDDFDVARLIELLLDAGQPSVREFAAADANNDGKLDGQDINPLVQLLTSP